METRKGQRSEMCVSTLHTTEHLLTPYLGNWLKISNDPYLRNSEILIMSDFFLCGDGQLHTRPPLLRHREQILSPTQRPITARYKRRADFRTKSLQFLFEFNKNQNASTYFSKNSKCEIWRKSFAWKSLCSTRKNGRRCITRQHATNKTDEHSCP